MTLADKDTWTVDVELEPNTHHVTRLFFAHRKSIDMMKDFPEVLLMDCTYKTNRFKMPLLDMVGVSSLGTTFHFAFAFLMEENAEDYAWALANVAHLYEEFGQPEPNVIVIDRDLGLLNALEMQFLNSQCILARGILTRTCWPRLVKF